MMLNLARVIKPWKEADALSAHINLYGFWTETTFLTKSGDLGMVLSVAGVDYESLDNDEQQYAVKRLESALKSFGEGFHVYQYLFKTNRPEIPFATYDDELIDAAIDQRRQFFESKRDRLYQIEIFYVIVLEGARSKTGILPALVRIPRDPQGGIRELKAQFTSDNMKVLLRTQIDADLVRLEQRVQNFTRQLADLMPIEVQGQQAQFSFFRRLLNFDDWRIAGKPQSTQYLDYQVVNSNIEAERDHLRVGDHFVRILTMKEAIAETRPLVLDALLKIEGNFYVVTEWTPLSMAKARKEVDKRRRHFNMSKSGFVSQMGSDPAKTNPARRADRRVEAGGHRESRRVPAGAWRRPDARRFLAYGRAVQRRPTDDQSGDGRIRRRLHERRWSTLHRDIQPARCVLCDRSRQLRPEPSQMYLLNSNYADLSFLFTIHPGREDNPHLRSEYLLCWRRTTPRRTLQPA